MKWISSVIMSLVALVASATDTVEFAKWFADSTLRVDYALCADRGRVSAYRHGMRKIAGWAGRRHNLDTLALMGNGQVTMRSRIDGRVIYTQSFSTLMQEWLSTPEAKEDNGAWEMTALLPLPKDSVDIELTLTDMRRDTIARCMTRYYPGDILVASRQTARVDSVYMVRSPREDAIDVVLLSEGYTVAERDSFLNHARVAVDEIMSYEPWRQSADRWNFVAVFTPSADSGVSVPAKGQWLDTAFGSHFSTFYSARYLTTPRVWALHDAAEGVPYEHIIVLANTDEYGGGGIYNNYTLTAARNEWFRPVVVHEFGHSFGGLADEYFYDGDVMEDSYPQDIEPWEPNITTLVDFGSKWRYLLDDSVPVPTPPAQMGKYPVGVYEGGGYSAKGVYRPAFECRMRNNSYPTFCGACASALTRLIDFYCN